MADLRLQDPIIEVKDLAARPKALDEESQDNVFGGFFGNLSSRFRRQPPRRGHPVRGRPVFGRPQYGRRPPRRQVPVYAWRRVLVGYRYV